MTTSHGGRRHGLSPSGVTKPRQMRLGPLAEARLAALMAETGQNASEVVRALLLAPEALSSLSPPPAPEERTEK